MLQQILLLQQYLPFTVLKLQLDFPCLAELEELQQYLPFTVLKLSTILINWFYDTCRVATVLTVYGIETWNFISRLPEILKVATVLTVYGIETQLL